MSPKSRQFINIPNLNGSIWECAHAAGELKIEIECGLEGNERTKRNESEWREMGVENWTESPCKNASHPKD